MTPIKILESSLDGWHGLVWFMCSSRDQYLIPEECSVPSDLGLVRIHSLHSSAQGGSALIKPHWRRAGKEWISTWKRDCCWFLEAGPQTITGRRGGLAVQKADWSKEQPATADVAHSSVPCSVLGALDTVLCPHLSSSNNALLAKVPVDLLHGLHRDQSEEEDGIRMDTRGSGGHTYSIVIKLITFCRLTKRPLLFHCSSCCDGVSGRERLLPWQDCPSV